MFSLGYNIKIFSATKSAHCSSSSIQNCNRTDLAKISCCDVELLHTEGIEQDLQEENLDVYRRRQSLRCAIAVCTEV